MLLKQLFKAVHITIWRFQDLNLNGEDRFQYAFSPFTPACRMKRVWPPFVDNNTTVGISVSLSRHL